MNGKALAYSQKKLSKAPRRLKKLLRKLGIGGKHPARGASWLAAATAIAGALGKVLSDRSKLQELIDIAVDAKKKAENVLASTTTAKSSHRHHRHDGHAAGAHG